MHFAGREQRDALHALTRIRTLRGALREKPGTIEDVCRTASEIEGEARRFLRALERMYSTSDDR